ncbi:helical hairpin domain-containing protein, partial [Streptococcus pyogenes]
RLTVDIGCPFVFVSFKTDCNTQSFVYFYSIHPLPYRKRVTLETLKEKVEKINLLMEIHTPNQTFLETKDQLVQEIATLDMKIEEIQEKIATLNKMAEVFINLESDNKEGKRLARYNLTKTNIPLTIKVDQVEREIEQLQISLTERLDEYEGKVSELEEFVQMLNTLELPLTDRDHLDRNRLAF